MTYGRWLTGVMLLAMTWAAWAAPVSDGQFTIHYEGTDTALAQTTLSELQRARDKAVDRLPLGTEPVTVYVCDTASEFIQRTGPFGRVDIGGVAQPDDGIIIMKAPYLLSETGDYRGILRHELVHILLARNVNTDSLPRWLNEGLAMQISGERRWESWLTIGEMVWNGKLLEYRDLLIVLNSSPGELSYGDAYAQSLSMTAYLTRHMGEDAFWTMMRDLDTQSFGVALESHTGWTPYAFTMAWKRSLWTYALAFSLISGISLFQVAALLLVWGYWRKRRQSQAILTRMGEEEDDEPMPWEVFDSAGPYDWEDDDRRRF